MTLIEKQTRERIRDLNDTFRKTLDPALGKTMLTAGVSALSSDVRAMAIRKVATFDAFDADNDSHGEHDFGSFDLAGCSIEPCSAIIIASMRWTAGRSRRSGVVGLSSEPIRPTSGAARTAPR